MTVAETFQAMITSFDPARATGVNKTLQWNIGESSAGQWAIHVRNQTCELIPGGVEKPDIVFHANESDWLAISEGRLDETIAFMMGKVKIAGDMALAMKVHALFPKRHRA